MKYINIKDNQEPKKKKLNDTNVKGRTYTSIHRSGTHQNVWHLDHVVNFSKKTEHLLWIYMPVKREKREKEIARPTKKGAEKEFR